jgi:hypothetical protein
MVRGHLIAAGAAALLLAFVAGCGEGAGPPEIRGALSGPITQQRVDDFARRVNLRASDLPGARIGPPPSNDAGPAVEEEAAACGLDALDMHADASVSSHILVATAATGERASFTSTVSAYATGEESIDLLRQLRSSAGFACFERTLKALIRSSETPNAKVLKISMGPIHRPVPLATDGVGVRTQAVYVADGKRHSSYIDVVLVSAGNSTIELSAVGVPDPVDQDVERELLGAMVERAERHSL